MVFAEHYDSFVWRQTGVIFGGLGLSFIPADFQPSACHFASGVFDPPYRHCLDLIPFLTNLFPAPVFRAPH